MDLAGTIHTVALTPVERRGPGLAAGARGRVLDIGGRARTAGGYGPDVTEVVVWEPDARGTGPAQGPFDTIVSAFALCRVTDVERTVAALRAVLRPEGALLFVEHVLGRNPVMAAAQRVAAPAWARVAGGCRVDRDAIAALRAGGFVVTDCERLAPLGRLTAGTVVSGRAITRREVAA